MNSLLIGLVGALMATNQPTAVSNLVYEKTGLEMSVADQNDPVEKRFVELMLRDDQAQQEVDKWIQENDRFSKEGAAVPAKELNQRILARFEVVKKGYEEFIAQYPRHARARVAYASFLDDIHDEEASHDQLEKARELDATNPAIWNNLANYYGHYGDVKKAFDYYTKAIELNPKEPIYYQNFGTTVFLFRVDAMEHYKINEQQVFDRALELYGKAMKLTPDSFPLATDIGQTYYGIKPLRFNEAMNAWTNALKIASSEVEREGVYIHMARFETMVGKFDAAAAHINSVTNQEYAELKRRVSRSLEDHKSKASGTNGVSADENIESPAPLKPAPLEEKK